MTLAAGDRVGPYAITAQLGRGGMGEVYRAADTRLGREVAIKVLADSFAADRDRIARFEREARVLASLNHPNIAAVYGLEEIRGALALVLELVPGPTLGERLEDGALPVPEALAVARDIASALEDAHEKGIVHRDLKPANVKLAPGGRVKVLDFGLAKAMADESGESSSRDTPTVLYEETQPGVVIGTVAYMSPEQARGLPVDRRSDVWSFGAVLYEMLAGRRLFEAPTPTDLLVAVVTAEIDWGVLPEETPPAIRRLLRRCLERNSKNRLHDIADARLVIDDVLAGREDRLEDSGATSVTTSGVTRPLPRELRAVPGTRRIAWAVGGGALLAVLAFFGWRQWAGGGGERATPEAPRRLAVLPFDNVGAATDQYFADGVADEIRSRLAAVPGIAVIASASANLYRGSTKAPEVIAAELGVGHLLTAKVRWQRAGGGPDRIRVTPELVEVAGRGAPTTRWQQTYDAEFADLFAVQGEIALRVASALEVVLTAPQRGRLASRPTDHPEAYDAFLRGQEIEKAGLDAATLRRATAEYERAVERDPDFAAAWARLAGARALTYSNGVPDRELGRSALAAAERALALAPELAEAHRALGFYHHLVTRDPARALESFSRGLALAPNDGDLLRGTALAEQSLGRFEGALEHLERAQALDPRSFRAALSTGNVLLYLRRPEAARAAFDHGLALAPGNLSLIEERAMTFLQRGDLAGARREAAAAAAAAGIPEEALAAYFASYWDLDWVLDERQRDRLLGLGPEAFDGDAATWGIALAQAAARRGGTGAARRFAQSAWEGFALQAAESPDDAQRQAFLGLSLAYLGRCAEARRTGERAVALEPIAASAYWGPYLQHQLVRIHLLCGEPAAALDRLTPLLAVPGYLTPEWLSIDPNFEPLRADPRFRALTRG
jgi:TolB-like protein/Flp pilus assembly protein TadD